MFQHQAKYGGWRQNISAEGSLSVDFILRSGNLFILLKCVVQMVNHVFDRG